MIWQLNWCIWTRAFTDAGMTWSGQNCNGSCGTARGTKVSYHTKPVCARVENKTQTDFISFSPFFRLLPFTSYVAPSPYGPFLSFPFTSSPLFVFPFGFTIIELGIRVATSAIYRYTGTQVYRYRRWGSIGKLHIGYQMVLRYDGLSTSST